MKLILKKTLFITSGVFLLCILIYSTVVLKDYSQWLRAKKAIAEGGICDMYCVGAKITKYSMCILDSDYVGGMPTRCGISCSNVSNDLLSFCVFYNETDFTVLSGDQQKQYIATPKTFVWLGGGAVPQTGMQMIAGGLSNDVIEAGAIPASPAVNTIQNIIDRLNFYITGFKDKFK